MSKEYNSTLQARVEQFLKDKGISQAKAAPMMGISQTALSQYRRSMYDNGDIAALESKLEETKDPFLKNSMMLVVDAVEPEKVKQLLEKELDYLDERHAQDRAFYDKAAAYGPAFGMIGTLMGLINLMKKLSDPDAIPPAMALALVTTFYGSVLANCIFTPISNKLRVRHEEEYLCKLIIAEGVESIQAGDNPTFIEEKLTQLIPGYLMKKGSGGGKSGGEDSGK